MTSGRNRPVDNRPVQYGSNNAAYVTTRIARERRDILACREAGEFRSVRQAAIAAGGRINFRNF
jgi:hypothetical protein